MRLLIWIWHDAGCSTDAMLDIIWSDMQPTCVVLFRLVVTTPTSYNYWKKVHIKVHNIMRRVSNVVADVCLSISCFNECCIVHEVFM